VHGESWRGRRAGTQLSLSRVKSSMIVGANGELAGEVRDMAGVVW
jgi:hypothetical protein